MAELIVQLSRFTGVGFMSAIGHYGMLITLVQVAGVAPVQASVAGALLGAWINYSLNYRYTFRSTQQHRQSMVKFSVTATVGLILNTILMWVGVDLVRANYLLSQIATTMLVFCWSFIANRYWTFKS